MYELCAKFSALDLLCNRFARSGTMKMWKHLVALGRLNFYFMLLLTSYSHEMDLKCTIVGSQLYRHSALGDKTIHLPSPFPRFGRHIKPCNIAYMTEDGRSHGRSLLHDSGDKLYLGMIIVGLQIQWRADVEHQSLRLLFR